MAKAKEETCLFCPRCGAQNDDAASFCLKCGLSLAHPDTARHRPGRPWTRLALLLGIFGLVVLGGLLAWRYWAGLRPGAGPEPVLWQTTSSATPGLAAQVSGPSPEGAVSPAGPPPLPPSPVDAESFTTASVPTADQLPTATQAPAATPLAPTPLPTATPSPSPTLPPTPELWGRIVFATNRFGDSEICVINADGSNLQRLTSNQVYDWHPNWSPDGKKIVFVTNRDGAGTDEIYLMNPDGSGTVRLTHTKAEENTPIWHPDGNRIFFSSERDGNWELYSMSPDGSHVQRLTDHPALDQFPVIAPNGRQMAFASERDGNREIYVSNIDGTSVRRLTNRPEEDWAPAWSPRGDWIAFASKVGDDEWALYLIKPDGSGQTRLTHSGGEYPAWSPDGNKIAFLGFRNHQGRLYIINADGSDEREITHTSDLDWSPAWSR